MLQKTNQFMYKKITFNLLLLAVSTSVYSQIVVKSNPHDPNKVTHSLDVGNLKLGVSSKAGGAIVGIQIPGPGGGMIDIMQDKAETYGRLTQSSIRDKSHNLVYNPTQAGSDEEWGTPCVIDRNTTLNTLDVRPHRLALWYGDGKYDFVQKKDLYAVDFYERRDSNDVGDDDYLLESGITQNDELASEFTYTGSYEDYRSKLGVSTPVVLHHMEYAFNYNPNNTHALKQFAPSTPSQPRVVTRDPVTPGSPNVFDSNFIVPDISVAFPSTGVEGTNIHEGTYQDMNNMVARWIMRWDETPNFNPKYRYVQTSDGVWNTDGQDRWPNGYNGTAKGFSTTSTGYRAALILSDASNKNLGGRSIGLYRPANSLSNSKSVYGRYISTNNVSYRDDRTQSIQILDNPDSFNIGMTAVGFTENLRGMLNKTRLVDLAGDASKDRYETYANDYFILYGTVQNIMDAIAKIDAYLVNNPNLSVVQPSAKLTSPEVTDPQFKVYPNPANEVVNVTAPTAENIKVTVYNALGKLVYTNTITNGSLSIPTNQLGGPGLYILKCGNETKKVIIEN